MYYSMTSAMVGNMTSQWTYENSESDRKQVSPPNYNQLLSRGVSEHSFRPLRSTLHIIPGSIRNDAIRKKAFIDSPNRQLN